MNTPITSYFFSLVLLFPSIGAPEEADAAKSRPNVAAKGFYGEILSLDIQAEHFGVVIDVSESMRNHLPRIRKILKEKAPRNPVVHVDGCALHKPDLRPKLINGVAPDTVTAVDFLGDLAKVSCVLWISDLGDPPNRDGIIALQKVLRKHNIQLLVASFGGKPTPSIRKTVHGSDGFWQVVKPL